MKTVVYQSYRTTDVPAWVERCLHSVRSWAAGQGFDYWLLDDRLFAYAPHWYRDKVAHDILLVTDLARLEVARELLTQGYERTIWVDADLLIFDPEHFVMDVTEEYAFCAEVWVLPGDGGRLQCSRRVNNAVTVFTRSNSFLGFYIHACQAIVRQRARVDKLDVGTRFLSVLHEVMPLPLIRTVGALSPLLTIDLVRGVEATLRVYMAHFGSPVYAGNLCTSFRNCWCHGVLMDDGLYQTAVDLLLQTRGTVFNQHLPSTLSG